MLKKNLDYFYWGQVPKLADYFLTSHDFICVLAEPLWYSFLQMRFPYELTAILDKKTENNKTVERLLWKNAIPGILNELRA